jgi:hypothetical protein
VVPVEVGACVAADAGADADYRAAAKRELREAVDEDLLPPVLGIAEVARLLNTSERTVRA